MLVQVKMIIIDLNQLRLKPSQIFYYDDLMESNMRYDGVYLFEIDSGVACC